jgi:predicted AAA+ superfamily ATPase
MDGGFFITRERLRERVLTEDGTRIQMLTGPRQVGKTTILEKIADENRKMVSLDNPTLRASAKREPELFLQRYAPPVLIDEIQYAPELFEYIKAYMTIVLIQHKLISKLKHRQIGFG